MAADHVQSATSSPNIHSAAVTFSLCTCSVYLLDYTSEVEVTSCVDCRIFIGKPLSPISGCPFCTAGAGQLHKPGHCFCLQQQLPRAVLLGPSAVGQATDSCLPP